MMLRGYIESELQSALSYALPGDDVAGILLALGAVDDVQRTRICKVGFWQPKAAHTGASAWERRLAGLCADSGVESSLRAPIAPGDADGVQQACSWRGASPATPLEAWNKLQRLGLAQAIVAMQSVPGFEALRLPDDAIEARLAELERNRDLDEVPF